MMEDLYEFLIEFMGAVRLCAVSDGGRPFCRCCSSESRHCRRHITSSKFSPVPSVQVHVRVGALPIVLSESRYITSVQHSESVVVSLSDSDQLPT